MLKMVEGEHLTGASQCLLSFNFIFFLPIYDKLTSNGLGGALIDF